MTKIHNILYSFMMIVVLFVPLSACAQEPSKEAVRKSDMRQYMFVADIGPAGWQQLIDNPSNRETVARESIAKLGGELVAYYFGFNDSRNYVIVNLPDRQTAKAIQVLNLSRGALNDYQIIELMSAADIEAMANSMQNLRNAENSAKDSD